jgi:hypothetical protein
MGRVGTGGQKKKILSTEGNEGNEGHGENGGKKRN